MKKIMKKRIVSSIFPVLILGFALTLTVACEKDDKEKAPDVPSPSGTLTDIDGNTYQYIIIGTQKWMIEDLKVTKYLNGDPINNGMTSEEEPPAWVSVQTYAGNDYVLYEGDVYRCKTENADTTFTESKWDLSSKNNYWWTLQSEGAYCAYDNNSGNINKYGLLYNWHVVNDARGIAPEGWRVPTAADWDTLCVYLGGANVAGEMLKDWGTEHWLDPNYATNESGFTAMPSGVRFGHTAAAPNPTAHGKFMHEGSQCYYWEIAQNNDANGWTRNLYYGNIKVSRLSVVKTIGASIRLVSDVNPPVK